ncbi:hypothetical protein G9A89_014050 [Geosiphon pyriformis]|nr:hypothetical protein G9A89_014050 [Geosiphon pyriformis]
MDLSLSNHLSNNNAGLQSMKLPIPRLQPAHSSLNSSVLNSKPQEMLITSAWPNTTNTASLSLTSSLPVIPCETPEAAPIGKPVPNKRGRKPLTTMPSTKKHIQNLTNQRAFRQRRENYVRTLESKATNLEYLYAQAQEEIKTLKKQLGLLKKQLIEGDRNVCGGGLNSIESMEPQHHVNHNSNNKASGYCGGEGGGAPRPTIYAGQPIVVGGRQTHLFTVVASRESSPKDGIMGDVVMSESAMSPSSIGSDGSSGVHSPTMQSSSNQHPSTGSLFDNHQNPFRQQCLSPTSPTAHQYTTLSSYHHSSNLNSTLSAVSSFSYNDQQQQHQQPEQVNHSSYQQQQQQQQQQSTTPPPQRQHQMRLSHSESVPHSPVRHNSVDELIEQSFFCETKGGELCYCEPDPVSDANIDLEDTTRTSFQAIGGRSIISPETGKRMWILPTEGTRMSPNSNICDPPMTPNSYYPISNGGSPSNSPPIYTHPLPSPDEPEPRWQLQQQQQQYYSQSSHHRHNRHSQHHPNPKWLRSEEQSIDGRA